jgi:hypothetical protein
MEWSLFVTKLETAETMEGFDLNMRAQLFYSSVGRQTGSL